MQARSPYRRRIRQLAVLGILAALALGVALWYFGPWSRPFRLSRMDLVALDAEAERAPEDPLPSYYLGVRLLEKGATAEAAAALRRAVTLRPGDGRFRLAYGRALYALGHIDGAFQHLKSAEGDDATGLEARRGLAALYERTGAYHKAEEQWQAIARARPDDAQAWHGIGYCNLQMQQVRQATEAADRALRLEPHDPDAMRLRASIAAAEGDLDQARRLFEEAIRLHPGDARAHHDLANFLLTQERSPASRERAERAVAELTRLQPDHPLLPWHRARLAAARGEWDSAVVEFERALQLNPGLHEALFQLANAYYRTGERAKGDAAMAAFRRQDALRRRIKDLREQVQASPKPGLYFELGRLRREAGQLDAARRSIQDGLELAPGDPRGLAELRRLDQHAASVNASP